MSVAPSVQDFVNDFQAQPPRLRLGSPISDVKYIGAFYAQQMAAHRTRTRTVRDLLRNTANRSLPQIRQLLAEYVQNRNSNTCVRYRAQNAPQGVNRSYHVRDFNYVAFNSLRNLLAAARQLNIGRQGHAARLPTEFDAKRDASTGECSCRLTRAACNRAGAASCQWQALPAGQQRAVVQNRSGFCKPVLRPRQQQGRRVGAAFPGVRRNEPGQKRRRNQAADPNQQFVGVWRVPD